MGTGNMVNDSPMVQASETVANAHSGCRIEYCDGDSALLMMMRPLITMKTPWRCGPDWCTRKRNVESTRNTTASTRRQASSAHSCRTATATNDDRLAQSAAVEMFRQRESDNPRVVDGTPMAYSGTRTHSEPVYVDGT